jgi:thiol-disulfide isomerase/thioredoxin
MRGTGLKLRIQPISPGAHFWLVPRHQSRGGRNGKAAVASLFSTIACVLATACSPAKTGVVAACSPQIGKAACEIDGEHLYGEGPASLAEGRGHVVLVDFWATTCRPCRKSFPEYQHLVDLHGGELAVLGVSTDSPEDIEPELVKRFAVDLGVSFPILWDKEGVTARTYDPPAMPTSYLIDKEGILRHVHKGFQGDDMVEVRLEVEALLQ